MSPLSDIVQQILEKRPLGLEGAKLPLCEVAV